MKAYDTRWSCELIEPYLKPDGLIAGVQNGMTTDTIAEVVGPETHHRLRDRNLLDDGSPRVVMRHSPRRSWFAVGAIDGGEGTRTRIADCSAIRAPSKSSTTSGPPNG